MARIDTLANFLTDVATAIKTKTGKTDPITPANFDTEIKNIEAGGSEDEELVASYISCIDGSLGANCTKLPNGITSIGEKAFYDYTNLALTELPESIISIGSNAFNNCINLALTKLPSGITSISSNTFNNCPKLALTELPSGITLIGDFAFCGCTNLALTELPENITLIDSYVFYGCTSLTEMTCLGDITRVSDAAFNGCTNLTKLAFPNITSVPTVYTNTFTSTPIESGTGYIYVPDDLVDSFKSASDWSSYANQIKPISELPTEEA